MIAEERWESVGFIGGGRVTRILCRGWLRAGCRPTEIRICETDGGALERCRAELGEFTIATAAEAAAADLVVLAVHPPAMRDVLELVAFAAGPATIVLSLAPSWTVATIGEVLDSDRVVRAIPNAPSVIGEGYTPVCYGDGIGVGDRRRLAGLFAAWGETVEVAEEKLEAYAVLSAMGPTYHWFQWRVLRELGESFGLSREEASAALRATVRGSVDCLLASDLDEDEVMDLVPVRPLANEEAYITWAYQGRLPALHRKITPAGR